MSWERKVEVRIGDHEVVSHTPGLMEETTGVSKGYTVGEEEFDTLAEAIERAVELDNSSD